MTVAETKLSQISVAYRVMDYIHQREASNIICSCAHQTPLRGGALIWDH